MILKIIRLTGGRA